MADKKRADVLLTVQGLCESRERAQAAIMEGRVYLKERRINKSSELLDPESLLTLRASPVAYVSRGALKLEKALRVFKLDLKNRTVMDVGASTGGFTDVCLKSGARKVYAIDVGYGQLDWTLRNDPRVTVMERTNARFLEPEAFPERPDTAVMDVSFISIRLILPALFRILGDQGMVCTLIKPQFEAGRSRVGKNGVVRDPRVHEEVLDQIAAFAAASGWPVRKLDYSPITGPKGNIEFLAELRRADEGIPPVSSVQIRDVVQSAHEHLTQG